jgi:uncharacterized iron-regulated protein
MCAEPLAAADPLDGRPWSTDVFRDHALVGRIWLPAEHRFADAQAVMAMLAGTTFVLLGEKHDNADHHRIQAWLVQALLRRGRRPAVAFEMFTTDQSEALQSHLAAHPRDANGIAAAVDWVKSGWPDWQMYRPIAQAALDVGVPVLAANPSRLTVRRVAREGLKALASETRRHLGLDEPLPAAMIEAMRAEVIESHCGMIPEAMTGGMVDAQAARDAHMANVMARAGAEPGGDGVVLIAGDGHVRTDRGVPWHLRRLALGRSIAAVGVFEVREGESDPVDYLEQRDAADAFDVLWFTPRVDDRDPCEKFAPQLKGAAKRHKGWDGGSGSD